MRPSEADIVLRSLRVTQDMLDNVADLMPLSAHMLEERLASIAKIKGLMRRVSNAPPMDQYVPQEIAGTLLVRLDTGEILAFDPTLERMTGYTYQEMVGVKIQDLPAHQFALVDSLKQRLDSDGYVQETIELVSKFGTRVPVLMRAELITSRGPNEHELTAVFVHFWMR
jgi:PAS domain S-box-containing protein